MEKWLAFSFYADNILSPFSCKLEIFKPTIYANMEKLTSISPFSDEYDKVIQRRQFWFLKIAKFSNFFGGFFVKIDKFARISSNNSSRIVGDSVNIHIIWLFHPCVQIHFEAQTKIYPILLCLPKFSNRRRYNSRKVKEKLDHI